MNRTVITVLGIFVAVVLLAGAFSGGFLAGQLLPDGVQIPEISHILPFVSTPTTEQQAATPGDLQNLFIPFWEALDIVHNQYVDQPVDDVALMQGAIRGMMDALGDQQTFYMDLEVYEHQATQLQGSYEGIGAYVDLKGDYLTIISPIESSPAEAAGLQPCPPRPLARAVGAGAPRRQGRTRDRHPHPLRPRALKIAIQERDLCCKVRGCDASWAPAGGQPKRRASSSA